MKKHSNEGYLSGQAITIRGIKAECYLIRKDIESADCADDCDKLITEAQNYYKDFLEKNHDANITHLRKEVKRRYDSVIKEALCKKQMLLNSNP